MLETLRANNKQRGATLVSILTAVAVIGIAMFAIMEGSRGFLKAKVTMNDSFNLSQTRGKVINSLANAEALNRSISANPIMNCLAAHTDCSAQKNQDWPIKVLSVDGEVLSDPNSASAGLDSDGKPCAAFNPANGSGSDACPTRFDVRWKPICPPAGSCMNPQNRFTGTITFNSATRNDDPIKFSKYNFVIFPARDAGTLEANCTALQGTFNSGNGTCSLPLTGMCPPGQVVVGISANNTKSCGALFAGVCPNGYAIDYIDINGGLTCKLITYCPGSTDFPTWTPGQTFGDGGGGGDGCDGADGGCGAGGS